MRHKANKRVKKYREEQEKRGYKNLSLFCSEELRAEFDRLNKENGMSKQDVLDHMFSIYKQAVDGDKETIHETIPVTVHANKSLQKASSSTPDKYPNHQDLLFEEEPEPLPDCHGQNLTVPERDKFLLQIERMFPGKGQNRKRAEALNDADIKTGRGKIWTPKLVRDNLIHAKKRAKPTT